MSRKLKRWVSLLLAAALLLPAGWMTPVVEAEEAGTVKLQQSFEDGDPGGWGALSWGSAGTTVVSSVYASEGSHSLQFKDRASKDSKLSIDLTSYLESGHTYDISFKIRLGEGTDNFNLAAKVTSAGTDSYPWIINPVSVSDASWTLMEKKGYVVPDQTTQFLAYLENGASTADVFIDEVLIVDVSPAEVPPSEDEIVTVYHETFEDGQGKAVVNGSAVLTPVTGKSFDGNEDGAALHVTGRSNNWDGVDFNFADIGMENGKEYTITVVGYVDEGVSVPSGAEVLLQNVTSYNGLYLNQPFVAGEAFTLTGKYTVDTSQDRGLRVQSNDAGQAVPFYIGEILITGKKAAPQVITVYHETFEDGQGKAVVSGSAVLTPVTGKAFDGNEDGAALHVTGRSANWHGVDFNFVDIGMENGKEYTITVAGYVDEGVSVPSGAEVLLQNVNSYNGLYLNQPFVAGEAFALTGKYTVDTSKDRGLRVQSNDAGQAVPFYIGEILITTIGTSDDVIIVPPDDETDLLTDFEDNTVQGWTMRNGVEGGDPIAVVSEDAHESTYSLLAGTRMNSNDGPMLDITTRMAKHYKYKFTTWVKMAPGEGSAPINMALQISYEGGQKYPWIVNATQVSEDQWVKLEGEYILRDSFDQVQVYLETGNNGDTKRFYVDDFHLEILGPDVPLPIQDDLASIYETYEEYFDIGNVMSSTDFNGDRLKLLKKHHNLLTAENAMKPDQAYNADRQFDFASEDALVKLAQDNGFKIHGHVLVWHQQSPIWLHTQVAEDGTALKDEEGNTLYLSREDALENLRNHVTGVVEHFGNKVISWDVVNEAMNDNPQNPTNWEAALRESGWLEAIGPDYIYEAYRAAREVVEENGWDIKLYYNDYNDDNQNKATAIASMVKELNERYAEETNSNTKLIDGIGMQGHYNLNTKPENVKSSLEKFTSVGVEVGVTELDITAGSDGVISEKEKIAQGFKYADLFKLYKEHQDAYGNISRITFWGLDDASSWRNDTPPLLFDARLQAKPAYYGVIDPDKFIAEHDREENEILHSNAAYGTPAIDGTVDSVWSKAPELPISRYQMAWQGANGTAQVLWDNQHLYVLVQVNDAQLDKGSANAYEQDSVEVFLDENNGKTFSYEEDDGQFRVNFDNETSFNPESLAEGFESVTRISGTDYTVELKIPFKTITPSNNTVIGFDAQINDAKDGARQSIAAWNDTTGQGFQDPSVFGELTLIGKPSPNQPTTPTTPSTPATPGPNVPENEVPVTVDPDGTATASIDAGAFDAALNQAQAGRIEFKLNVPADAKQVTAKLPADRVQTASESGVHRIVVNAGIATLELPASLFAGAEAGAEIELSVSKADPSELPEGARSVIGDNVVFDFSLSVGGEAISRFANEPVRVSFPYELKPGEKPGQVVVYYIADDGSLEVIKNGRYHPASGMIEFNAKHFSHYAAVPVSVSFADLGQAAWAEDSIAALAARGIVQGVSDDAFAPKKDVTRAEFVHMLVQTLDLEAEEAANPFRDAKEGEWYYDAVTTAHQLGIAYGNPDGSFGVHDRISRQDMAVMAFRALAAAGLTVEATEEAAAFPDEAAIAGYAKEAVTAMQRAGIISGMTDGTFAPAATANRAQAAVILNSLLNRIS